MLLIQAVQHYTIVVMHYPVHYEECKKFTGPSRTILSTLSTRSGYFSTPKQSVLDHDKHSTTSESSSSTSSSDSSDEVLSDKERVAVTNQAILNLPDTHKRRKLKVIKSGQVLYIHKRWRTLRLADDIHSQKLTCGRPIKLAYVVIDKDQSFPYVKCKDCFGA